MINAGFDSADSINGSMLPISFICASLICALTAYLIRRACRGAKFGAKFLKDAQENFFWNFYITTVLETVLEVGFSSAIRIGYFLNTETWWQTANCAYAVFYYSLTIISVLIIPLFLYKNRRILRNEEFEQKFGSLLEMMSKKKIGARYFQSLFLSRRVSFIFVLVMLPEYPCI